MKYANMIGYSDVEPYEVVRVVSDTTLEIRSMTATLDQSWKPNVDVGGFVGHTVNNNDQKWNIESNQNGVCLRVRLSRSKDPRKNGKWFDSHGRRFNLSDQPRKFYDYNF